MENFATLLIPALMGLILARAVMLPIKLGFKLAIHALCGFLCLWLLNTISVFTGIAFPINAVTVLIAGCLGVPGIAVMALLEAI